MKFRKAIVNLGRTIGPRNVIPLRVQDSATPAGCGKSEHVKTKRIDRISLANGLLLALNAVVFIGYDKKGDHTMRRAATSLAICALVAASILLTPQAKADIFDLNGAAMCTGTTVVNGNTYGGNLGGGLCTSAETPFQLSALLTDLSNGTIVLGAQSDGTDKFVVTDDIAGNSFSFGLTSTGQNNTGVANNAQCQINGGATAFANACSILGADGATTSLGAAQINGLMFPATISFSGSSLTGSTFNLEFVSMQGQSRVVGTPEPGSMLLLGCSLLSIAGIRRKEILRK